MTIGEGAKSQHRRLVTRMPIPEKARCGASSEMTIRYREPMTTKIARDPAIIFIFTEETLNPQYSTENTPLLPH